MIIITSAAYVTPGLVAEFGKLPPCMLPLKNRRLYVHQVNLLRSMNEKIILSLPNDYEITPQDKKLLSELDVRIVQVPINISLGASIIYVLNLMGRFNEPLRILHGDTLLNTLPIGDDICSVSKAVDDYNWTEVDNDEESFVYVGYFSFSSQANLIRCITEENFSFMEGIEAYRKYIPINFKPADGWCDFGIVNTYYRSKSKMTTQRVFNDLRIDKYSVIKRSKDINKILNEANWFKSIPVELKHFVPALWQSGIDGEFAYYQIEYYYLSSLSELFVFGNNPLFVWRNILDSCVDFLNQMASVKPVNKEEIAEQSVTLYGSKTNKRFSEYAKVVGIDMDKIWCINGVEVPSLNEIIGDVSKSLNEPQPQFISVLHGDFCFSNILYDFKSQSIKVLDPRGRDLNGNTSIYGDFRYDVGKLAHSVIGLYDFIIGGFYEFSFDHDYSLRLSFPTNKTVKELQEYFIQMQIAGFSIKELSVYPILIHLFLSMLPLHDDHPMRQKAMFANALRLYAEYKSLK